MAYVYVYFEEDIPRYVGKGNADRDIAHLKRCKNKRFAKWLLTVNPRICRVADNLTEDQAYALEKQLIAQYGRIGYETGGTLLNHSLGGRGGTYGAKMSNDTRLKMSVERQSRNTPEYTASISQRIIEQWKDPSIRDKRLSGLRAAASRPDVQSKKSASMLAAGMRMENHPNSKNYRVVTPEGNEYFFRSKSAIQQFFPAIPVTALGSSLHNGKPVKRGPAKGWSLHYHGNQE